MSIENFHKSTVTELLAVKDRVRNLINHWPEEGRHHEAVLKNVIKRFLPNQFEIGTGFVVKSTTDREIHESSKQIDLIIYNIAHPVFFKEGDFVILTPDAVYAIIEVKANLQNQNLTQALQIANENGQFVYNFKVDYPFYNGIFSFEGWQSGPRKDSLETAIVNSVKGMEDDPNLNSYRVNHIAFNENLFYKFWPNQEQPNKLYKINYLSFAYFISNLIDVVSVNSVIKNNNLWFPRDKGFHLEYDF